jgi:phosphoribosylformylglycinamidine (FGAM) synthase-like enzyme
MLSESQERMVLAVDPARVEDVARAVEPFGLALADIGEVVPGGALEVTDGSDVQASLPARLLTHGAPRRRAPQRIVGRAPRSEMVAPAPFSMEQALQVLGHPECRSRADIFTQYDSMVKTSTVAGPGSDAAILRLRGSAVGLALTLDGQGRWGAVDAYAGGARAVAEAAMNLTVTGARPLGLSDGLNAGSPDDPEVFQAFALMVQGIADAARALRIPVTGGNVSFYNQTGGRVIWPTPVIGMVGVHPDPLHPVPTGFPGAGLLVYRLGYQEPDLAATVFRLAADDGRVGPASRPDFERLAAVLRVLGEAHHRRLLRAAHDISDGGLFVALAEMVLAGSPQARGVVVELPPSSGAAEWFNEGPGQAIVAVDAAARNTLETLARTAGVPLQPIGRVEPAGGLRWERGEQAAVTWTWGELWTAWQGEVSRGR